MSDIDPEVREAAGALSRMWWLSLVTGIAWFFIALVILQMNAASLATVGVIVGAMCFQLKRLGKLVAS